jgi:hypothetical protein
MDLLGDLEFAAPQTLRPEPKHSIMNLYEINVQEVQTQNTSVFQHPVAN